MRQRNNKELEEIVNKLQAQQTSIEKDMEVAYNKYKELQEQANEIHNEIAELLDGDVKRFEKKFVKVQWSATAIETGEDYWWVDHIQTYQSIHGNEFEIHGLCITDKLCELKHYSFCYRFGDNRIIEITKQDFEDQFNYHVQDALKELKDL